MPHPSDPRLLVLHGLRLKGAAEADALAAGVGLPAGEVAARLSDLESEVLVEHRTTAPAGWVLTAAGRAEQSRLQHRADPLLDDLAATLDRYGGYGPRLRHAVARVRAGDREWFTTPG